ncbi:hypothetical protein [Proteiniborus sp. MB09-C3]|uniref:hypothetical protein n=1 Tax=Proteiniborus sp. MB09-C3 TaxID=3050072 RepID=UPI002557A192|nr:hypothetical protein [Proteiniborus sp. MB09-C3]WIV11854.1 hypothetical protein QO263_17385 [Proteiniborus sp. MB09-C3]
MYKFIKKIIIILTILLGLFLICLLNYPLNDDIKITETTLRKYTSIADLNIQTFCDVDSLRFILFTYDNDNKLGRADLKKGIINHYKIVKVKSWDSLAFDLHDFENNGTRYILVSGKNHQKKISYVQIALDNKKYNKPIDQNSYFTSLFIVSEDTKSLPRVYFLDTSYKDITVDYLMQKGTISTSFFNENKSLFSFVAIILLGCLLLYFESHLSNKKHNK